MSGSDFYYEAQSTLAAKLAEITPGPKEKRVFFRELRCRGDRGRPETLKVSYTTAFCFGLPGSLSMDEPWELCPFTASKAIFEKGFSPLVPGVTHVPYPYCYRCPFHYRECHECNVACVNWIREDLFKRSIPPEEVAAIFVEPIQGEGGYVVPPPSFIKSFMTWPKNLASSSWPTKSRVVMGRTGKMMAIEHWGVIPDIIALAKGIASGMPLGAMVSQRGVMDWVRGSHASTFGGNPISCQAGLATIELLLGGLVENAARVGDYILAQLKELQKRYPLIGDVRGKGLMIGIEMVKDPVTKEKAVEERNQIIQACFEKGLLVLGCGENVLRLCPPLIITQKEADTALSILEEVLRKMGV